MQNNLLEVGSTLPSIKSFVNKEIHYSKQTNFPKQTARSSESNWFLIDFRNWRRREHDGALDSEIFIQQARIQRHEATSSKIVSNSVKFSAIKSSEMLKREKFFNIAKFALQLCAKQISLLKFVDQNWFIG